MAASHQALLGSAANVILSIDPLSQIEVGGVSSFFYFASTAVTIEGGTPTAIEWSIQSPVGGSFSIFSGQGTPSCIVYVEGVAPSGVAIANLRCTVTVGGAQHYIEAALQYERM